MKFLILVGAIFLSAISLVVAEDDIQFEAGSFTFTPVAAVQGTYDDRVTLLPNDKADGDFYTEVDAGLLIENLPARYNLSAYGFYGYRFYDENTDLDGDYYSGGATLNSADNPFKWSVSSRFEKTLRYDTEYNANTGAQPGSVLSDTPNQRIETEGTISYDVPLMEKTALRPQYSILDYHQEVDRTTNNLAYVDEVDYMTHEASLQLRRSHTETTVLTASGGYSFQDNDEENGQVVTVKVGAERRATDEMSWLAEIGYSYATYEESGDDHGPVAQVRGNWVITEKVSAYIFGSNEFQPGYGDTGARYTYRLGYGAGWQFAQKMSLQASLLHDYQDEIGDKTSTDPSIGEVRSFFNSSIRYRIYRTIAVSLGYRYVADEIKPDQQMVYLRLGAQL